MPRQKNMTIHRNLQTAKLVLAQAGLFNTLLETHLSSLSPHLCVGFLFLILYPASSTSASSAASFAHNIFHTTTLSHNIFHTTTLSRILFHTQLCHTSSFTHNFVTQQLCHTSSFTHNFVTHHFSHTTLSPTIFHTPSLSPTIFHTHPCQPPSFTHYLSDTIFHTWRHPEAWHLATTTFASRGRRGTW